jgi:serine/threonine protein kinase
VTTEADFEAEKHALELLLDLRHENIIELFTTYAYGPSFNLLMPWADFTLFKYLRSAEPPKTTVEKLALFEEMACVASALDAIHNFEIEKDGIRLARIGYHHDLKPQNILIRGRKFLIADFGLARFKELDEQSETRWKLGTRTYGPPESGSGTKISRAHDIWSFGCVLSEVVTFAQLGSTGIEEFAQRRLTQTTPEWSNDYFHNKNEVKPEVLEWFRHLDESKHDVTIISSITNLVLKILDPNPKTRPRSKYVQTELAQIVKIYEGVNLCSMEKTKPLCQTVVEENKKERVVVDNATISGPQSDPEEQWRDTLYRTSDLGEMNDFLLLLEEKVRSKRTGPRLSDEDNWPVIHLAAVVGEERIVHKILMLEHLNALIATNDNGSTALHVAAEYGQTAVLDVILACASSNSLLTNTVLRRNSTGKTPLHLAAENGRRDCAIKIRQSIPSADHVRDLLEEKDDFGDTPVDLAKQNGHEFMIGCLSSADFCF